MVQWLRIHLPIQGTWVWFLFPEDPTGQEAAKPEHHSSWNLHTLGPVLRNERSHHNEKPTPCSWKVVPTLTRESPCAATKTQCSQKLKIFKCFKKCERGWWLKPRPQRRWEWLKWSSLMKQWTLDENNLTPRGWKQELCKLAKWEGRCESTLFNFVCFKYWIFQK